MIWAIGVRLSAVMNYGATILEYQKHQIKRPVC